MKTRTHQPNFKTLGSSGKKFVWDVVSLLIFFFFTGAIGGFLWEVLIFLIKEGNFYNRGFLYGPWLLVYGIGAVLFYVLLGKYGKRCKKCSHKIHPRASIRHFFSVFLLSCLIGTSLELLIGWQLDLLWGLRYWDYAGYFLNFHGYICFLSAIGFGVTGLFWICFLSPALRRFWFFLPEKFRRGVNTILVLLFVIDCAAALILPNIGKGITFH